MKITWLGHSCFKIEKDGYIVILDPYFDGSVPGLLHMREKANTVLCSHGHKDHAGTEMVEIAEKSVSPFSVKIFDTYHDDAKGTMRGTNKIHVIENDGIRIAHMGDLGCELTGEQKTAMQEVDVMLIPVGGFYTIDARQAKEIITQCNPKLVIPMHYRSEKYQFGYEVLAQVEDFIKIMTDVTESNVSQIDLGQKFEAQVLVMRPQNIDTRGNAGK